MALLYIFFNFFFEHPRFLQVLLFVVVRMHFDMVRVRGLIDKHININHPSLNGQELEHEHARET